MTESTQRIGIVCALAREAQCLSAISGAPHVNVEVAGIGPAQAAACATRLLRTGSRALVSFGFAGGLDPDLSAGTVVLPEQVRFGERIYRTTERWHRRSRAELAGMAVSTGALLTVDEMVPSPQLKAHYWAAARAVALDMESGAIGAIADAAEIPWLVVRAICDDAQMTWPRWLCEPRGDNRTPGMRDALVGVLKRPADAVSTAQLAIDEARARRALRRASEHLSTPGD